jgi:hypothetical protein
MTTGQWNVRWPSLAALAAINDPARLGSALGLLGFVEPASTS